MSELRSKCCGARWYKEWIPPEKSTIYPNGYYQTFCRECHKPAEIEEKAKRENQQYVDDVQRRRW